MRVALVHYRLEYLGGLESRIINYSQWFVKNGHQVTVVCGRRKGEFHLPPEVEVVQLKATAIFPSPLRHAAFAILARRWLKGQRFDYILSMARTLHQTAVIGPGNHSAYLRESAITKLKLYDRMQLRLDRQAFIRTPLIFPASEMVGEEIVSDYGVSPDKLVTLYPPSNPVRFNITHRQSREEIRRELGVLPGQMVFFAIGASARKGYPMLKRIFADLPSERFVLWLAAGDAKDASLNIKPLGYRRDVEKLLTSADAFLLPSPYEPYGAVIQEALMCGTPVIMSDKVGAKSWVKPEYGQILPLVESAWKGAILHFDPSRYTIPPDVGEQNGCTLDQHMERMMRSLAERGLVQLAVR